MYPIRHNEKSLPTVAINFFINFLCNFSDYNAFRGGQSARELEPEREHSFAGRHKFKFKHKFTASPKSVIIRKIVSGLSDFAPESPLPDRTFRT